MPNTQKSDGLGSPYMGKAPKKAAMFKKAKKKRAKAAKR
jgi:hypothetical protein